MANTPTRDKALSKDDQELCEQLIKVMMNDFIGFQRTFSNFTTESYYICIFALINFTGQTLAMLENSTHDEKGHTVKEVMHGILTAYKKSKAQLEKMDENGNTKE